MKRMKVEDFWGIPFPELKAIGLLGESVVIINDDNTLSLELKTEEKHMNLHGTIQAGIQYLICDATLGMTLRHIGRPGVAMGGNISFYRPAAPGDTLTATVIPHKMGRRTGNFSAELKNQNGKMVSECMFSVMFDQ